MVRAFFLLASIGASVSAAAQPATPASIRLAPEARALFERDWVLMNWALKFYDRDHDILISDGEARIAAAQFRKLADVNGDGRITPDEYRAARAFILARY